MKTLNPIRFALLAAAALFTHAAFAGKPGPNPPPPPPPSSGVLVLDYLYPTGDWAMNLGLAVAPSGIIYVSGTAQTDRPGQRGLVLSSSDSGAGWAGPLDDFGLAGFHVSFGGGIVLDAAGNIYIAGLLIDDNFTNPDHWIIRRSTNGGGTWVTVDDFVRGQGWSDGEEPGGIAVDAAGDVYVAGTAYNSGTFVWTVRKGVGGTSFSTVDAMSSGFGRAMDSRPTLGLFAAGSKAVTIRNKTDW